MQTIQQYYVWPLHRVAKILKPLCPSSYRNTWFVLRISQVRKYVPWYVRPAPALNLSAALYTVFVCHGDFADARYDKFLWANMSKWFTTLSRCNPLNDAASCIILSFFVSISGHREPIANLLNIHQNLLIEETAFWIPPSFVLYQMWGFRACEPACNNPKGPWKPLPGD